MIRSHKADGEPIVAVALLTARELDVLGEGFRRSFPIGSIADFDKLLQAIDDAELALIDRGD